VAHRIPRFETADPEQERLVGIVRAGSLVEVHAVNAGLVAKQSPGRKDDLAGRDSRQAQQRHIEQRARPDLRHAVNVGIERAELDYLEADAAPARRLVEEAELVRDATPVIRRLRVIDPAKLERDEPVELRRVVDVEPLESAHRLPSWSERSRAHTSP
jgi:hypothetical protein